MSNIFSMQHQIQQLRFKDRVKELTYPHLNMFITDAAADGLIHLLEGSDMIDSPRQIKFYSRAIYLGLAISEVDANNTEDMIASNIKSSLHHAHSICSTPEEFHAFLQSDKISQLMPYYHSQQHQQIENRILYLTGSDFCISTPYDFITIVKDSISSINFENTVSYLIDFCLTIPETSQLTSEEIFVGCCLVLYDKLAQPALLSLMLAYFQTSMGRGISLAQLIKQSLVQIFNEPI